MREKEELDREPKKNLSEGEGGRTWVLRYALSQAHVLGGGLP